MTTGDERGKGKTTIARKSEREVVVTRTVDAPARIVFQAWTKPELFLRWWVPKSVGITVRSSTMDIRTGGKYRLEMAVGEGPTMAFFGTYLEVTPHSRLVWTNEEGGGEPPVTTVTLEEKDGKTLVVLHERHASKESLDAALASGAMDGFDEQFGQLDELLVELAARG